MGVVIALYGMELGYLTAEQHSDVQYPQRSLFYYVEAPSRTTLAETS